MAIFHLHVEPKKRQCERSSILGAAAYRAAVRLTDKAGQVFDFRRKKGVLETQYFLPPQAPAKLRSLQGLWRAVEAAEPAKGRATWAQEVEVSLPVELTHEEHKEIISDFIRPLVETGYCVQASYEDDGGGNPHVHILISARKLGPDGQWQEREKTRTVYANTVGVDGKPAFDASFPTGPETRIPRLDKDGQQIVQLRPGRAPQPQWERVKVRKPKDDLFDKETLIRWRKEWAGCVNRRLQEHGLPLIDHRSLKEQGIDRFPQRHLGSWATQLEKRGQRSRRGDWNRAVRRLNALQSARQAREQALEAAAKSKAQRQAWQAEIQEQIADQRLATSVFMALCDDPTMRQIWLALDSWERKLALQKLEKSRSLGRAESSAEPMVSRLVVGLFESCVAPALEPERKAQEAARKAEAERKAQEAACKVEEEHRAQETQEIIHVSNTEPTNSAQDDSTATRRVEEDFRNTEKGNSRGECNHSESEQENRRIVSGVAESKSRDKESKRNDPTVADSILEPEIPEPPQIIRAVKPVHGVESTVVEAVQVQLPEVPARNAVVQEAARKAEEERKAQGKAVIKESFADPNLAAAVSATLDRNPSLLELWAKFDDRDRESAIKKVQQSFVEGQVAPAVRPLIIRFVTGLFEGTQDYLNEIRKEQEDQAASEQLKTAPEPVASKAFAQKKAEEDRAERERQRKAEEEADWAELKALASERLASFEAQWAKEEAEQEPQPQQQEQTQVQKRKGRGR